MFLRYQKYWFEFYLLPIFSETKRNIFLDFLEDILMLIIFELVLAREIPAQHQDICHAFVTTNDCFTGKATKISSLSWRRTGRFPAQNGKDRQTLGLLGLGRK